MSQIIASLQTDDGDRAEIHPLGAQLTSWKPAGGGEHLFLSSRSSFAEGTAIRGGVPIIFPQFAALGRLPKHGFARNRFWQCVDQQGSRARWRLQSDAATRAIWPQDFDCRMTIELRSCQLSLQFTVLNTGAESFEFTAALHTYLRVNAIEDVQLRGLRGLHYRDKTRGDAEFLQSEETLRIEGEVDRIYLDAPPALQLIEPMRQLRIEQSGFTDSVVWNPGPIAGAALPDLENEGYRRMLCVEAAVVRRPVSLAPGSQWQGRQTLIAQ